MHLLVTRPEPDAQETARRLTALGHTVTVAPLLTIVFAEPPADLPRPAALLVTSGNGVRALVRWPQSAAWRDVPVLAVGDMTAEVAREAGFHDVRVGGGDAAALAALVTVVAQGAGPILYPAARDRSGSLADDLAADGYDVRVVEAYRAETAIRLNAPVMAALTAGEIDGALFYSRRTAEAFRDLVAKTPINLANAFVLSEQVAAPLAGLASAVRIASAPNEASLLALIPAA